MFGVIFPLPFDAGVAGDDGEADRRFADHDELVVSQGLELAQVGRCGEQIHQALVCRHVRPALQNRHAEPLAVGAEQDFAAPVRIASEQDDAVARGGMLPHHFAHLAGEIIIAQGHPHGDDAINGGADQDQPHQGQAQGGDGHLLGPEILPARGRRAAEHGDGRRARQVIVPVLEHQVGKHQRGQEHGRQPELGQRVARPRQGHERQHHQRQHPARRMDDAPTAFEPVPGAQPVMQVAEKPVAQKRAVREPQVGVGVKRPRRQRVGMPRPKQEGRERHPAHAGQQHPRPPVAPPVNGHKHHTEEPRHEKEGQLQQGAQDAENRRRPPPLQAAGADHPVRAVQEPQDRHQTGSVGGGFARLDDNQRLSQEERRRPPGGAFAHILAGQLEKGKQPGGKEQQRHQVAPAVPGRVGHLERHRRRRLPDGELLRRRAPRGVEPDNDRVHQVNGPARVCERRAQMAGPEQGLAHPGVAQVKNRDQPEQDHAQGQQGRAFCVLDLHPPELNHPPAGVKRTGPPPRNW